MNDVSITMLEETLVVVSNQNNCSGVLHSEMKSCIGALQEHIVLNSVPVFIYFLLTFYLGILTFLCSVVLVATSKCKHRKM